MIILKNAKEKKNTTQNAGHGGMRPHHPGVHVIISILILIIPVPISTLQAVAHGSGWGAVVVAVVILLPLAVSQCCHSWSGLIFIPAIVLWLVF